MKPSTAAIIRTLQRTPGEWVDAHFLQQVGGLRYGARLDEARELGYAIETRLKSHSAQYRLMEEPGPQYASLSCACGWNGTELTVGGGRCGKCGTVLVAQEIRQEVLL